MDNSASGGHQIYLARSDYLLCAEAFAVRHRTAEKICNRCQTDMRMRQNIERSVLNDLNRTELVSKNKRSDRPTVCKRQDISDIHCADTTVSIWNNYVDHIIR